MARGKVPESNANVLDLTKIFGALLTPSYWKKAQTHLKNSDPVLAEIIGRYRGEFLRSRGAPFETLFRSIVGQQISVKAADSVWAKVSRCVSTNDPHSVSRASVESLRAAGLSARKVEYAKDLAAHFIDHSVDPDHWKSFSDEEVIQELIQIRGIGRWTAEMFLIFSLLRPDVFPADDLGLQKAISLAYKKRYPMSKRQLELFRKRFSPWGSVATWYLWRSLDPIPVEY